MLRDFLKNHITSQAKFVEWGYGQVEPNHLSAQRTAQIYGQLPADKNIKVLEQGQFIKYDYANGVCNFSGPGEWMLVYNEIKLYRDHQDDCEFAMLKDNYQARVYSPFGYSVDKDGNHQVDDDWSRQSRYYNGNGVSGHGVTVEDGKIKLDGTDKEFPIDDVTASPDMYEIHYSEDPFHILAPYKEARMPEGTTMVPRVFKTNVGDIYTTNMINVDASAVTPGMSLYVGANGILTNTKNAAAVEADAENGVLATAASGDMVWQVVKVYTMPDHQKGVKLMRIA